MKKLFVVMMIALASNSSFAQYLATTSGVATVGAGVFTTGMGMSADTGFNVDKKALLNDCINYYSLNEISEQLAEVIAQIRQLEEAKDLTDEQIIERIMRSLVK